MSGAAHLYVHVPFCAHRCGYCDFVTVTGSGAICTRRYVDALIAELARAAGRGRPRRSSSAAARPSLLDDALLRAAAGRRCRPAAS